MYPFPIDIPYLPKNVCPQWNLLSALKVNRIIFKTLVFILFWVRRATEIDLVISNIYCNQIVLKKKYSRCGSLLSGRLNKVGFVFYVISWELSKDMFGM